MTAEDRVISALNAAGCSQRYGGNWNCPGPMHGNGDRNPSLHMGYNGRTVALKCHTGCDIRDILSAIGLEMTDLFDEPMTKPEPVYYRYLDADGEVLFAKLRYEPKRFSIKHPVNGSGWEDGIPKGTPRVIYNLPQVLAAAKMGETIWVVEGEKDCDRLAKEGVTATCNFEGASVGKPKWHSEYSEWFAGSGLVNIVADRDPVGIAHAQAVAASLEGKVSEIRILQSRTEGKGHDVSDHLAAGYSLDQLLPLRPEGNEITRRYKPVCWTAVFKEQPDEIEWLKPDFIEVGTLTSMFSKPGIGKSLLALEIAVEVVRAGHTVMYIDDENRVSDTVDRLKAYQCKPEELDRLIMYSFAGLPALDTDEGGQHLDALSAESQPKLVIMDTVSRMVTGEENAANTFLQLYRCSLVPLKARGIAVLRLDHSGKDDARGMRGSSAKESDVDFVWRLARDGEHTFSLECQKSRNGHIPFGQIISLERKYEPLRHIWDFQIEIPLNQYEHLIKWMDSFGIPVSYGRERTRGILREHNVSPGANNILQAAILERRNRARKEREVPVLSPRSDSECPF